MKNRIPRRNSYSLGNTGEIFEKSFLAEFSRKFRGTQHCLKPTLSLFKPLSKHPKFINSVFINPYRKKLNYPDMLVRSPHHSLYSPYPIYPVSHLSFLFNIDVSIINFIIYIYIYIYSKKI